MCYPRRGFVVERSRPPPCLTRTFHKLLGPNVLWSPPANVTLALRPQRSNGVIATLIALFPHTIYFFPHTIYFFSDT